MAKKKRQFRQRDLINLVIVLAIIVVVNFIATLKFDRFDLTTEGRYTLTEASIQEINELEDRVYIRVYLDGDMSAPFQRLRSAIKEMLDEMVAYSNGKLGYKFINPSESTDEKVRREIAEQLTTAGIDPFRDVYFDEGTKLERFLFPGVMLVYREKEIPVYLLKNRSGGGIDEMIGRSIEQLEYELMQGLFRITKESGQKIGVLEGHGELDDLHIHDLMLELRKLYAVERVEIDGKLGALDGYQALIIANPDTAFDERDKFVIDQFIMSGNKVLWLVDGVDIDMEDMYTAPQGTFPARGHKIKLVDQLNQYGVRVDENVVLDKETRPFFFPARVNGQIVWEPRDWFYNPTLKAPEQQHPITSATGKFKTEFVSTLTPVEAPGNIKRTVLLTTSERTMVKNAPHRVSFNIWRQPPRDQDFASGERPVAMLLEGTFESLYKGRIPLELKNAPGFKFKESSLPTAMVVIGDGEMAKNDYDAATNQVYELGMTYRPRPKVYSNKDLLLNAMNYLMDDNGLIQARSKKFQIRLLDQAKLDKERDFWQVLNTALPIFLIFVFGGIQFFRRRSKFAR